MQKMKTRRAAAKRFTVTGTGEIRRNKAYKSHILEKKSPKRKRNLRKACWSTRRIKNALAKMLTIRIIENYNSLGGK